MSRSNTYLIEYTNGNTQKKDAESFSDLLSKLRNEPLIGIIDKVFKLNSSYELIYAKAQ